MRRGHAGIGGWRNENPRHYKSRGGGPPQFKPNRSYPLQESSRFPQAGSRPPRGTFNNRPGLLSHPPGHHDRNKYRYDSRLSNQYRPSNQDRHLHQGGRAIFPLLERMRHESTDQNKSQDKFYHDVTNNDNWHINSMGDIDDRQINQVPFGQRNMSPWLNPPDNIRQHFDDRNTHQPYRHDSLESNKIPVLEYSGHRPPSSDHYGGNASSTLDNSNSFSRSVDDTVDIIRRRLQNRDEIQLTPEEQSASNKDIDERVNTMTNSCQNIQQNQPTKKKIPKHKHNIDANCDKMKNKIVHELFKMDKDKIHKLMDNPSSSSKFEYALNSFITESQNSLNRHLRSVAEKSLCTSEEFVHNDNNTIYEDTFMKQMQGVLDPQDTILLEDIKPLVLAELSKVLQLNELELQMPENEKRCDTANDFENYEPYQYENFSQDNYYEQIQSPQTVYEHFDSENFVDSYKDFENVKQESPKPAPLFERRPIRKSFEHSELNLSSQSQIPSRTSLEGNTSRQSNSLSNERRHSRSLDNKLNVEREQTIPLFDTNTGQLSEDEDPFAELDKQYHVAVDHNFIETNSISSPQQTSCNEPNNTNNENKSPKKQQEMNSELIIQQLDANNIKQEIDSQLHTIAKSPLKLPLVSTVKAKSEEKNITAYNLEQVTPTKSYSNNNNHGNSHNVNVKGEYNVNSNNENKVIENTKNINIATKDLPSNARKRSIDQKPSHRKEKRKKSESNQPDPGKQILNKNIIINVNDCASSDTEKCKESAKSVFNLFFSKTDTPKEVPKETKHVESDKSYSQKYVKRKETQKTTEIECDKKKRQRSVSSSHSIVSPKENINNNSQGNKTESKAKLQTIDMFVEQPRKVAQLHQTHRNTNTPVKTVEISKPKAPITFNRKITKRHISTQVCRKMHSKEIQTSPTVKSPHKHLTTRFSQTERKKMLTKGNQTDPVRFEKSGIKATDTFERMKEIDLEIQVLLQEKFKLYNSIESSDPCPSIHSLGMTVVNVTPDDDITKEDNDNEVEVITGDDIVEDFTNIPVEELEQIALETIQDQNYNNKPAKKSKRKNILDDSRASSSSPTTRRKPKKVTTPNISLLEQIITDDRPLEDIISLDDLESTPVKSKKQKSKVQSVSKRKLKKSKISNLKPKTSLPEYKLKECSVVLIRSDLSRYYKQTYEDTDIQNEKSPISMEVIEEVPIEESSIVVGNDLQFDMLDVSEDIVIGDNCEVKSSEDKDIERTDVSVTEEIILDNSQSHEPLQSNFNQVENICRMYDYSTDDTLRRDAIVVTGHADAVLAIECVENNFIAACLDGNVYHFGADGQLLATLRGSNLAVTCLTIVKEKYGTTVYTGSLDSRIRYYDLETGLEKGPECNVLSPIQTMDRAWDTIFVGTRTGFVLQFECKNNMLIPVSTVKFSDQSILALRAMKEGPRKVLLVAARSEDVTIKDAQTGLLLRSLRGPKMTVYTLLYEDGKIYCGTSSHQIHVFDYASGGLVGGHEGGKGAVCLRAAGGLVFAGCYDGCVYVYREGEPRPIAQLRGPGLMLLSLAVLDTRIIAGYKDRSLYIWKIPSSIQQEMIL